MGPRAQTATGWATVALAVAVTTYWAVRGIVQNFREGWYHETFLANVAMMVSEYLAPMFLFMGASMIGLRWPRLGAILHVAGAAVVMWLVQRGSSAVVGPFLGGALLLLAAGYWRGRPEPRRWAWRAVIGLPAGAMLLAGSGPAWRVATRLDHGDRGVRRVVGGGVTLDWAPAGSGWPNGWTATSTDDRTVLRAAYDGGVWTTSATAERDKPALRAVRPPTGAPQAQQPPRPWAVSPDAIRPIGLPRVNREAVLAELEYRGTDTAHGVVVDLNSDGRPDYVVRSDARLCGTGGCAYLLIDGNTDTVIGRLFGAALYVQAAESQGYPIITSYAHLGVDSGTYTTWVYDGTEYRKAHGRVVEGPSRDSLLLILEGIPVWRPDPVLPDSG